MMIVIKTMPDLLMLFTIIGFLPAYKIANSKKAVNTVLALNLATLAIIASCAASPFIN
jgi:hypothetical protein